jgi:hypothetical protein
MGSVVKKYSSFSSDYHKLARGVAGFHMMAARIVMSAVSVFPGLSWLLPLPPARLSIRKHAARPQRHSSLRRGIGIRVAILADTGERLAGRTLDLPQAGLVRG